MACVATLKQAHLAAADTICISSSSCNDGDRIGGGQILGGNKLGAYGSLYAAVKMFYADIPYPCIFHCEEVDEDIGMLFIAAIFSRRVFFAFHTVVYSLYLCVIKGCSIYIFYAA